jgi:hypothetical protein
MSTRFLALALAFSVVPVAAFAQNTNGPTDAQRQSMHQSFQRFAQQEAQLHQQMRWQILSSLTPVHRRAVGATIGELAITPNPDVDAAAKRLDSMLTGNERQRILAAHSSFFAQSRQLHEQMRAQMRSMMPDHPDMMKPEHAGSPSMRQMDAGMILLGALSPHPFMMGMGHGGGPFMMHMDGAPPH